MSAKHGFVYAFRYRHKNVEWMKVGMTASADEVACWGRIKNYIRENDLPRDGWSFVGFIACKEAHALEQRLHRRLRKYRRSQGKARELFHCSLAMYEAILDQEYDFIVANEPDIESPASTLLLPATDIERMKQDEAIRQSRKEREARRERQERHTRMENHARMVAQHAQEHQQDLARTRAKAAAAAAKAEVEEAQLIAAMRSAPIKPARSRLGRTFDAIDRTADRVGAVMAKAANLAPGAVILFIAVLVVMAATH